MGQNHRQKCYRHQAIFTYTSTQVVRQREVDFWRHSSGMHMVSISEELEHEEIEDIRCH